MNVVIVGVNETETSKAAARAAAELAAAYGTDLRLVMCAERHSGVAGIGSDAITVDWVADAERFLQDLARELPLDAVTWSVTTGDPADAILDEAERLDASTIVVGNVRAQGLSRVLGSVASDVMKKAPCNVLIAHTA